MTSVLGPEVRIHEVQKTTINQHRRQRRCQYFRFTLNGYAGRPDPTGVSGVENIAYDDSSMCSWIFGRYDCAERLPIVLTFGVL